MPFLVAPPADAPPAHVVLTDDVRRAVLLEARAHCAPSAWDSFARSLRARGYPVDPTTLGA